MHANMGCGQSAASSQSHAPAEFKQSQPEPEVVIHGQKSGLNIKLGEGAVWHHKEQRLLFVDILNKLIFTYDPLSHTNFDEIDANPWVLKLEKYGFGMVGTVVPCKTGGLFAATQEGFVFIDATYSIIKHPQTGVKEEERKINLHLIAAPEKHISINRFNDGKCDAAGRLWAGTMPVDAGIATTGSMYSLEVVKASTAPAPKDTPSMDQVVTIKGKDVRFRVRTHFGDVNISNGLIWSLDNKILYYIDTGCQSVHAFDYDLETGSISNRRVVIEIPREMGVPDGMTIDSEGKLWVCMWGGGCVVRWDPVTRKLLHSIKLPTSYVTSCAFGGKDLKDLYITTASNLADLSKEPLAGSLFVVRNCGYKGVVANEFDF